MLKELFMAGGWGMFPILLFGCIGLLAGAHFALRADVRTRGFLEHITKALVWFTVVAVTTDLIAVCHYLTSNEMDGMQMTRIAFQGFGESLSPAVMGPAFLALCHVLLAIGQRRVDAKAA